MAEYTSIITHNDFDGLGSAALLSWAFDLDQIRFAGPITIANAEIPITLADIVSDLPYPVECGLWFDHHAGNLVEVKLRGLDPASIAGRFAEAPSCVRVVFDFLREQDDLPEDFSLLAQEADIIDSFSYANLEAWRADTAANRIDRAIKASSAHMREHREFLQHVTFLLRDVSLEEAASDPQIEERAIRYAREEEVMLEHIRNYAKPLPEDTAGELIVLDTTAFKNAVRIDKKLIGLVYPSACGYMEMKPVFRNNQKTNDLALSLSLALSMQHKPHRKDMGEIVRELNIGDGHAGAAAGVWRCNSAHETHKMREELPRRVLELWRKR
ncbi:hypothetical protein EHM69_11520 [candidate division KSB1 bacterium]|nr:MAG: hypothetical protein EHM69_11520 [candidate division KSB1 bacterium]